MYSGFHLFQNSQDCWKCLYFHRKNSEGKQTKAKYQPSCKHFTLTRCINASESQGIVTVVVSEMYSAFYLFQHLSDCGKCSYFQRKKTVKTSKQKQSIKFLINIGV